MFWSCKVGYVFDVMDMQILSFVIFMLIGVWGLFKVDVGLIGICMLLVLVVGGWVVGILLDCIGCVCVLQIMIFWFVVFIFLCGFVQNYE